MNKENLTESMKRKTDKLIKKNEQLIYTKKPMIIYYGIACTSVLYFFFIDKDLWNNMVSFFDVSNSIYYQFGIIDKLFLVILIITFVKLYFQSLKISKLQKEYNKLRIDIITQMEQKLCLHSEDCNCKDRYIIEMDDEYKIDVVFK